MYIRFNDKISQSLAKLKALPWDKIFLKQSDPNHPHIIYGLDTHGLSYDPPVPRLNIVKRVPRKQIHYIALTNPLDRPGHPYELPKDIQDRFVNTPFTIIDHIWVFEKENGVTNIYQLYLAGEQRNQNNNNLRVEFDRKIKLSKRSMSCTIFDKPWGNKIIEKYDLPEIPEIIFDEAANNNNNTAVVELRKKTAHFYSTDGRVVFTVNVDGEYLRDFMRIEDLFQVKGTYKPKPVAKKRKRSKEESEDESSEEEDEKPEKKQRRTKISHKATGAKKAKKPKRGSKSDDINLEPISLAQDSTQMDSLESGEDI